MQTTDLIQTLAIALTFLMGAANLAYSMAEARKARRAAPMADHRRTRMDRWGELFAELEAMAHPDTILLAAHRAETPYHVSVTRSCSALKMLFDHRFETDAELGRRITAVADEAVAFYRLCTGPEYSEAARRAYEARYRESIRQLEMRINVYKGVEWSRMQKELHTGKRMPYAEWKRLYAEGMEYHRQWSGQE